MGTNICRRGHSGDSSSHYRSQSLSGQGGSTRPGTDWSGRCASCHSLEKAHHLPQTPGCPERRTTMAPWHHHHLLGLSASTHSSRLPPSAPAAFWPEPCSLQVLNGAGSRVGLQTGLPSPSSAAPVPIAFSREFGHHSLSRLLPAAYWAKYLLGALHGDIQGI